MCVREAACARGAGEQKAGEKDELAPLPLIEKGDGQQDGRKGSSYAKREQHLCIRCVGRVRFTDHEHQGRRGHKEKQADDDLEQEIAARIHAACRRHVLRVLDISEVTHKDKQRRDSRNHCIAGPYEAQLEARDGGVHEEGL